ncbi:MAG TPA: MBL fold metallo-hydrolase [Polyangiales bacterium]|nr:MBL fold metallo-hydrolase [Polyangiales bacterium]
MHVHHLNCATMCPRPAALIQSEGGGLGPARLVCHCLLVELRDGWALVDSGLGTRDVAQARERLGAVFVRAVAPTLDRDECALTQLTRLGLKASDVRYVLPTHLDLDHAGGIADFPDATVHLLAREHVAASARGGLFGRDRYKPAQWRDARFQLHEPRGERWFGFEGVRPLAGSQDELLIIPLPGHTHGHAGIAVRSKDRWLLHAGDAYFSHPEQLGRRAPIGLEVFQSTLEVDRRQRLANRTRIAELVRDHSDQVSVFCAHDPDELAQLASP